ncbi:MAG: hypothetical protein ACRC7C_01775 [Beijerinckiaceae bacterium]
MLFASLVLAGVGAGYLAYRLSEKGVSGDAAIPRVPISLDRLSLAIPAAYFRSGTPGDAATDRVDLLASFPGLAPAGPAGRRPEQESLVFIAISRGDGAPDPADRPQAIYGRFLEPDAWQNPGGLVMRRFITTSPYADEELFLAPPDGRQFSARCRKATDPASSVDETCLWRFRLEGADIQARFSPALLPQWETLERGVRQLVESWRQR